MRKLCFWAALLLTGNLATAQINFVQGDVAAAQNQAQREGKLVLIKFFADWCTPCQLMERTTWVDPNLVSYVGQNCVAVAVNYDNVDGITYRQFFNVERLPNIIILNACGRELTRFENLVTAQRLVQWLAMFNSPMNKACEDGNSVALPSVSMSSTVFSAPEKQPSLAKDTLARSESSPIYAALAEAPDKELPAKDEFATSNPASRPELTVQAEQTTQYYDAGNNSGPSPSFPEPRPEETELAETPAPTERPVETPTYLNRPVESATQPIEGTPNNTVGPMPYYVPSAKPTPAETESDALTAGRVVWETLPRGFSVQVFASASKEVAREIKNDCLNAFQRPVAIVPPSISGDNLYRVVVGLFDSRAEADRFKVAVRGAYGDAFVKDLGMFH